MFSFSPELPSLATPSSEANTLFCVSAQLAMSVPGPPLIVSVPAPPSSVSAPPLPVRLSSLASP
jgi:hypothetical protein